MDSDSSHSSRSNDSDSSHSSSVASHSKDNATDITDVRARVALVAAALSELVSGKGEVQFPCCQGIGARIVFGKQGDASSFEYLSRPNQLWPFVAGADSRLLRTGRRDQMALLEMIGFEREWVQECIEDGTQFRMVIFALEDCGGLIVDPTWDGLLAFVRQQSEECAAKLEPHVNNLRSLPFPELVKLSEGIERLESEEYAKVCSFEAYAAHGDDSVRHARAFLRHALKCTSLFAGDGYTRSPEGEQGAKEFLVPRCRIADLPGHHWIPIGPGSSLSDSSNSQIGDANQQRQRSV
jgi:hypothetical protein